MFDSSTERENYDQFLIRLAQSLIERCSSKGFDYSSIDFYLENALNKPVDTIISILNNNSNNYIYQKQISSLKISPFRRLAEEVLKFKKKPIPIVTKETEEKVTIDLEPLKKQEQKLFQLQEMILNAAQNSNSPKVKSLFKSININGQDVEIAKLKELFTLMIQEGEENKTKTKMVNLWSNVKKKINENSEIDYSNSIEEFEDSILTTVQSLKEQIDAITQKSIKTDSIQNQLISALQSQIENLKAAVNFKRETENFENDIKKHFENIENSLNSNKYDQLFENYKETFRKIEELSNLKNDLMVRNGNLEKENLLNQKRIDELIEENNKLKKAVSDAQSKKSKHQ